VQTEFIVVKEVRCMSLYDDDWVKLV